MNHTELRKAVTLYYIEQGYKSLNKACEHAKVNYTSINNMLNGRTEIKLPMIKELVENLNEKFTIKEIEGKYLIVRR